MSRNDPIILEIGIDICLSCPYPECKGAENLCDLIRAEVKRVKGDMCTEKNTRLNKTLDIIEAAVKDTPLPLITIKKQYDFQYGYLQSLMKRGFLETKREKWCSRTRIIITGVNR